LNKNYRPYIFHALANISGKRTTLPSLPYYTLPMSSLKHRSTDTWVILPSCKVQS